MSVCVIIPAWNAERTIARSIASALIQPQVTEVVVVDDASTDATRSLATAADDGTGRLVVLSQPINAGPSAARNLALSNSRAPYVAILDADDYFLPDRFTPLFALSDWDAVADNIAFVPEDQPDSDITTGHRKRDARADTLSLGALLQGGLSRPGRSHAELGFMKPVMRRAFLDRHALRYDETLRLSEDFMLYARMLAAGASFLTTPRCGYVAVVRQTSLSRRHTTGDLAALLAAIDRWGQKAQLTGQERTLFDRYRAQVSVKYRHRRLLDDKKSLGLPRALARALDEPMTLPSVAMRIVIDKMPGPSRPTADRVPVRYLLAV